MKMTPIFLALGVLLTIGPLAIAGESVEPKFSHELPNVPGKSLIAVEVSFPPGTVAAPHRHPASGFIYVYVLQGAIRSQVEGEPAKTYHAGESWSEGPGAHHVLAENVSKTEPAKVLAVFVVDSTEKALLTPDAAAKPLK